MVTISVFCPACGARRGTPTGLNACDDDAHYWVQTWTNPCGHIDTYDNVIAEAARLAEFAAGLASGQMKSAGTRMPWAEAEARFFVLRELGYSGAIDHDGYPVTSGPDVRFLAALGQARGGDLPWFVVDDQRWQHKAACRPDRGMDEELLELFCVAGDEMSTNSATADQIERAKKVCDGCPVRVDCLADTYRPIPMDSWADVYDLDDVYDIYDDHTIRGGLTGAERRDLRRRAIERRMPVTATEAPTPTAVSTMTDPEAQFEVKTDWEIRQESMTPDELAQYRAVRSSAKQRDRLNQRADAEVAS